jgi:hypothetical protein
MTNNDREKFSSVLAYLDVCFPDRKLDAKGAEIYFDSFSTYEIDNIFRVAKIYVQTGKRFPMVSDIVSLL